jgi:hypothetical protein
MYPLKKSSCAALSCRSAAIAVPAIGIFQELEQDCGFRDMLADFRSG